MMSFGKSDLIEKFVSSLSTFLDDKEMNNGQNDVVSGAKPTSVVYVDEIMA